MLPTVNCLTLLLLNQSVNYAEKPLATGKSDQFLARKTMFLLRFLKIDVSLVK